MFYANSGTTNADGAGFVSLYLSCEVSTFVRRVLVPHRDTQTRIRMKPTQEEKEIAVDGRNKWVYIIVF